MALEGQGPEGLGGLDGDVAVISGQGEGFEFGAPPRNRERQLGVLMDADVGLRCFGSELSVCDGEGRAGALWPAVDHGKAVAVLEGDVRVVEVDIGAVKGVELFADGGLVGFRPREGEIVLVRVVGQMPGPQILPGAKGDDGQGDGGNQNQAEAALVFHCGSPFALKMDSSSFRTADGDRPFSCCVKIHGLTYYACRRMLLRLIYDGRQRMSRGS